MFAMLMSWSSRVSRSTAALVSRYLGCLGRDSRQVSQLLGLKLKTIARMSIWRLRRGLLEVYNSVHRMVSLKSTVLSLYIIDYVHRRMRTDYAIALNNI